MYISEQVESGDDAQREDFHSKAKIKLIISVYQQLVSMPSKRNARIIMLKMLIQTSNLTLKHQILKQIELKQFMK